MPKITTVRERVHQPFFDTLIRTAGQTPGVLTDTTALFTSNGARTEATTNLINGSTLPSDQSHVTLALRVFSWYRNPILRIAGGAPGETATTGDFDTFAPWLVGGPAVGQAAGTVQDVYRLHSQTEEQLHWTFGTGLKPALENMPTWYFPAGGGLWGTLACQTDLIHFQNGEASHTGILRLARAVLLPPRQNLRVEAKIFQLPDAGTAVLFGNVQGGNRNMLSLKDNLNAVDAINKIITFTFDGCCSAATCSSNCALTADLAVEKPTSNEEPRRADVAVPGNPVVNRCDEQREPRETSAEGYRVTASRKQGRCRAGALGVVNGGHAAKGAVSARLLAA